MKTTDRILLFGCGILQKEVRWLITHNDWPVDTIFVDASLHCELGKLANALTLGLRKHAGRSVVVFYGSCHPLMDQMLAEAQTFRTEGQNCIEMLLGKTLFTEELRKGAYFLLEEWARGWERSLTKSFGTTNLEVIRDIFRYDRTYLLCLRTPCSGDFAAEAEGAGRMVGLPLRWMDVSLDHLESVLRAAISRKLRELQCQS